MLTRPILVLPSALLMLAGCGGPDPESTGSGGAGGAGSTSSTSASTSDTATGTGGPVPKEHRPTAEVCSDDRPPGRIGSGPDGECTADEQCTEGDNGRCVQDLGQPTFCSYDECKEDADCGGASVCECRNPAKHDANVCVHGNCLVDADCGPGGYCSPSAVTLSPYCTEGVPIGSVGYFCHTPEDECIDESDCMTSDDFASCFFSVEKLAFACHELLCVN